MNKKGFTLIELIAVMSILAIILLITVPSTLNMLEKNKRETFIGDAKIAIRAVSAKERRDKNNEYPMSYTVNNRGKIGINVNVDSINNRHYSRILVYVCKMDGIKYYLIYMTDNDKEIKASKGIPSTYTTKLAEYPDIDDNTSNRYNMVKKYSAVPNIEC